MITYTMPAYRIYIHIYIYIYIYTHAYICVCRFVDIMHYVCAFGEY